MTSQFTQTIYPIWQCDLQDLTGRVKKLDQGCFAYGRSSEIYKGVLTETNELVSIGSEWRDSGYILTADTDQVAIKVLCVDDQPTLEVTTRVSLIDPRFSAALTLCLWSAPQSNVSRLADVRPRKCAEIPGVVQRSRPTICFYCSILWGWRCSTISRNTSWGKLPFNGDLSSISVPRNYLTLLH